MLTEFDLSGGVALVTGGNRGIGRGIALGLARAGADIAIAARDEGRTEAVVAEIAALGRRALGVRCDVTARGDVERAVEATVAEFGRLSILVNNAGITRRGTPETHSEEDWDAVFAANLKATLVVSQVAYPALVANGGGKIINVSSGLALTASEFMVAYGASKAGMVQLTTTLAAAWGAQNIQVNAILPGVTRTEMNPGLADATYQARIARNALVGRIGEAEEFGGVAVFLASRASDFMTGQALLLDGGITIMTARTMFLRD